MTNPHPNATVATGTGAVTTAILWLAGKEHWKLPEWGAGLVATGVIGAVLFIGRNGVAGAWNRLLHGNKTPVPPAG